MPSRLFSSVAGRPVGARSPAPWGWAAITCVAILSVYAWIIFATVWEPAVTQSAHQPYNFQAEAFRAGQTNLPIPVPAGLAQLADPYDPAANASYRAPSGSGQALHDLSFYEGKVYLYFGVTPVLVLFEPWLLMTGKYFPEELAVLLFCSVGFLASAWLYRQLTLEFFPAAKPWLFCTGLLSLGFVSGLATLLLRPAVYEVAISCGYCFVMLTLVLVWRAPDGRAGRFPLALASLSYGLAVAARPPLLFGAIILLAPVIAAGRRRDWRRAGGDFLAAWGPLGGVGIAVLAYNASRFGNALEFGQHYQLAGINVHRLSNLFSVDFVRFNFRLYFWEPVHWATGSFFPEGIHMPVAPPGYLGAENPFGILTSVPFILLALLSPWIGPAGTEVGGTRFRWIQTCVGTSCLSAALFLCAFGGACSRYEAEFLPGLALLAALALLGLDELLAGRHLVGLVARGVCGLLLVYSVTVGLLVGASAISPHVSIRNRDLLALLEAGKKQEAIKGFETHVHHYPGNASSLANLGTAYFESGRMQDAVAAYQRALNIDPMLVEVYNNLGVALERLGRVPEARKHFLRALQLRPGYQDAVANLAGLERRAAGEK